MGQPTRISSRIVSEILGFQGWRVRAAWLEYGDGTPVVGFPTGMRLAARLILKVERCWTACCSSCGARCRAPKRKGHQALETRRWEDLPWAHHPVDIEATPVRVRCKRCGTRCVELLPWADPYDRKTKRLQHMLTLDSASMPTTHVAAKYGMSWGEVRRAELAALKRWSDTRPEVPLRDAGLDEKYLGRRHKRDEKFVTIASNLENGEPLWIGFGRSQETVKRWLATLTPEQKAKIRVFAMDMWQQFHDAIRSDSDLDHCDIAHDAFHIMKRAGKALNEIRKDTFFRAGATLRGVGRGTRWLVLRAWERCSPRQQEELRCLFRHNAQLGRAYQIVEELRVVVRCAPDAEAMEMGLRRILRRTQRHANKHLRDLHDSLRNHWDAIVALAKHRPATGRIEALNNNWETLIRRARGVRNLDYLLLKLRFMVANPLHTVDGIQRFLALGLPIPMRAQA